MSLHHRTHIRGFRETFFGSSKSAATLAQGHFNYDLLGRVALAVWGLDLQIGSFITPTAE